MSTNKKSGKGLLITIWTMFGGALCTMVYFVIEHFVKH